MVRKRVKKYSMEKELGSRDILLNPNHSHFVFVDDGTIGKFGVEIDLRSQFEECVSRRAGKPKNLSAQTKAEDAARVAAEERGNPCNFNQCLFNFKKMSNWQPPF